MSLRAKLLVGLAIAVTPLRPMVGQDTANTDHAETPAPAIFLDCSACDHSYIKTEITFVNYVRDRKDADVYVLITVQSTGSGGAAYRLTFMGQRQFARDDQVLEYFSHQGDTQDQIRKELVQILKVGLVRYVAKTPMAQRLAISVTEDFHPVVPVDRWKSWVFSLSASWFLNAEKAYRYYSVGGGFSANRVTDKLKMLTNAYSSYYQSRYQFDDQILETSSSSHYFHALTVKSLNEHWSVGGALGVNTSTYSNIRFGASLSPAVEFSALDYAKTTRRALRFLYRVNAIGVRYNEETIYLKIREGLWSQTLTTTLEMKEKWGTASASLEGSHYFHDVSKFHLTSYASMSIQLYKGLSANIYGYASMLHDQLSLAKAGASYEDILLRRRQLETSYSYYISLGLSFTFGSIYSNVVNPRFGSGGFYNLVN